MLSGADKTDRVETVEDFSMLSGMSAFLRRRGLHTFRPVTSRVVAYGPHMGVVHVIVEGVEAADGVLLRECAAYVLHRLDSGIFITGVGRVYPSKGGMTLDEAWEEQGVLGGKLKAKA
ncbi:hypothetical protein DFJ74DRAFT_642736 [Hyaloraphidium curvatum]|nr:hypothetical protein DFJ74DRAFT_642736 [Hyaloraphidium curvatum]